MGTLRKQAPSEEAMSNQVLCKHWDQVILSRNDLTLASINAAPHPFHKHLDAKENATSENNSSPYPEFRSPLSLRYYLHETLEQNSKETA